MKKIFILGVMLIMCLGIFAGCGPKKHGKFYTLQEAFEQGLLDVEDLKNIAYYQNGKSDDPDFEPKAKDPESLSEATEKAIKETRAYNLRKQVHPIKDAKADEIEIGKYYGTYNGYVAVMLEGKYTVVLDVVREIEVGGVILQYSNSNKILIWEKEK